MFSVDWYYIGHYGQLGPLTREQIDELIEGGVITRETYVWKGGMSSWQLAGSVGELSNSFRLADPYMSPPPPPMPMTPVAQGMSAPTSTMSMGDFTTQYGTGLPLASTAHTHPMHVLKSDRSRVIAGLLNLIPPGGIGRIYLGYAAYGVLQLVLSLGTCGVLYLWSLIDGIVMLVGGLKYDGYGRALDD